MIVMEYMNTNPGIKTAGNCIAVLVMLFSLNAVAIAQDAVFEFQPPSGEVFYSAATPENFTFTGSVSIQQTAFPDGGADPALCQGYSLGVGHDPAVVAINTATTVVTSTKGEPADFEEISIFADGVTQGIVFNFLGEWTLTMVEATDVLEIEYQLQAGDLTNATAAVSTPLQIVDTLGEPPVVSVVVLGGASIPAAPVDGTLTLTPYEGSQFIRGDVTQNGSLDIADGIGVLSFLFVGSSTTCYNSLDADDTGNISISDAVRILCAVFCPGSPPPAGPYPACGVDVDDDGGSCTAYSSCP
jgi:hypothetical protein